MKTIKYNALKTIKTLSKAVFILTLLTTSNNSFANETGILPEGEGQNEFVSANNTSFKPGEKLTYRLSYGVLDAGEAVLTVNKSTKKVRGRELWKVRGTGRTISAFEWFYKVNDVYESYVDAQGMFPWMFVRRVNEGGYIINQDYTFYQHKKVVDNGEGKKFGVPSNVQDMISAFYYLRTLDYDHAKIGDVFTVNVFLDDELYPAKIRYKGKQVVKTRKGKIMCHKFAPVVQEGRIFETEKDLTVWITDDANKIPIVAKAKIKVGSLKMHLVNYESLVEPLKFID
jgi:hypothetical protein